jgi:plasmid stabilization system protein ParE
MAIQFHRLATAEFVRARRWYAARSLAFEAAFVLNVDDAIQRIMGNPLGGSISSGNYRWVRVFKYPYVLHYEMVSSTGVIVYAVAHGKRKPGYWRRRPSLP